MLSQLCNGSRLVPAIGSPVNRLAPVFDQFFEGFFPPAASHGWPTRQPALWDDADNVYFEMDAPGATDQDLDVSVRGDELTIRGERKGRPGRPGGGESHGRYEQTVVLPCGVDPDRVAATLANGVLSITCPKAESARPRKIALKSA